MYWPDYKLRPRRKPRWGLAVLLVLAAGFLVVYWLEGALRVPAASPAETGETQLTSANMTATGLVTPLAALPPVGIEDSSATAEAKEPAATVRVARLGDLAPAFSLPDLFDQEIIHALEDHAGRPAILNFWASWCVPCRREMPALQATAARYDTDALRLWGMNQTYIDNIGSARTFAADLKLTFPQTRDDTGDVGARAYQVLGLPTTVFIDREGYIAHIQVGEMSLEQITTFTERLIAGQPLQP